LVRRAAGQSREGGWAIDKSIGFHASVSPAVSQHPMGMMDQPQSGGGGWAELSWAGLAGSCTGGDNGIAKR
jgi:hypothetical protein